MNETRKSIPELVNELKEIEAALVPLNARRDAIRQQLANARDEISSVLLSSTVVMVPVSDADINDLGLEARSVTILKNNGIDTVDKLVSHSADELRKLEWLGHVSVGRIVRCLTRRGLRLKD